MNEELQNTEEKNEFVPLEPIKEIEPSTQKQLTKISEDTRESLMQKAQIFVDKLVSYDEKDPIFHKKADSIRTMGDSVIKESANMSNRMLQRPVQAMGGNGMVDSSPISTSLIELRKTVEDLDPSKQGGNILEPRKLLGFIPFGNRLEEYFRKYQSAQTHLNAIIQSLLNGQDELRKDNATIDDEMANMHHIMDTLGQYVFIGKEIDKELEKKITQIQVTNPKKAKALQDDLLFYVRQKVQDLLTQQAVSMQGYLSLEMIRKNNKELIKGVDRATTTTVSALRTAVMVASALNNQKLVLDQINALNDTTSNIISSSASMLKKQSTDIGKQAVSSSVHVQKLQKAFEDIYAIFDEMNTYKQEALVAMKETVNTLTNEVDKAQTYIKKIDERKDTQESNELTI